MGGRDFFGFFLLFLMCSHKIPKFPMCSPTYSQIAPHFVPYALHNIVLFQQPLIGGPILGLICFYVWFIVGGRISKVSQLFCDRPIKDAHYKNYLKN
jgi:hypothetical protein